MLARISQQLPSIRVAHKFPSHSSRLHLSISDIRMNTDWLIGLVCILSAALFATLISAVVRSYMKAFQRYNHF
ncbi:hypothetical protein V8E53_008584 [Lactarius tabidus]